MSDAYIIRRGGGGGEGFDPNGAVLKVVTSTNCTVLVTGTGYSKTHQQADGFPRVDDANVTEHFFSIPASAFGTITVKATNTYGDNTKAITVNTAGKSYELLCGGVNIILDGTFGLQDGLTIAEPSTWEYDERSKTIKRKARANEIRLFNEAVNVTAYDKLTVNSRPDYNGTGYVSLKDTADFVISMCLFDYHDGTDYRDIEASIHDKLYPTAYMYTAYDLLDIKKIVLE